MGQAADRSGGTGKVDQVFDHPAFDSLKRRAAAFVVVRPETRDLVWSNAAAAAYWDRPAQALATALFGPPGRGWLGTSLQAVVPGRAPQMFRTGLAPGLGMRGSMMLARAVDAPDGGSLVGLAIPGTGTEAAPAGAWRRGAEPDHAASDPVDESSQAMPAASADEAASREPTRSGADDTSGADLAHRSQVAILRDRLTAATDGAATLRFLWRTDDQGRLTQIDPRLAARLGIPLTAGLDTLAEMVARFDPAAAERLGQLLDGRATWSGSALRLPVAGGAGTVPAVLGGSPVFGRDRGFEGFRGFVVVDIAGLEASPRATPAAAVKAGEDRDARDEAARPPDEPDAASTERPPSANVVDLRSFQAVRAAPPPVQEPLPDAAMDPPPERGTPDPGLRPAGLPDEEPVSDEMAFLALGAALRARIGDGDVLPRPADAVELEDPEPAEPEARGSGDEDAGRTSLRAATNLLERLPLPVLVVRDAEPVFVNLAAARALGFDAAGDVVEAGPGLVVESAPAGLALRNSCGETTAVPADAVPIEWEGAAAILWTFAASPAPETPSATPVAVEPDEGAVPAMDLVDRVDDAVALLDDEGRIRRMNERGRAWFGTSGVDIPGDTIVALLAPESRASALHLLEEARTRGVGTPGAPPRREVTARTADGGSVPMMLTLGRLGAAGFYATLRDLSALRRAEREEARSRGERERDVGRLPDLLARVSHEIRTPLNAILGFAEVMMDERFGPLGSPRYRDYLKDIHASGTQVVALVADLLDLSRIEAGRIDLAVGAVDVNKVVAEIVTQMQPDANRGRVIVRTSLASRIPSVMADERSARQIVQHLLSNAVKFNEPGGQVIVSTAQEDGGPVLLRIRDTGVGMTEAEIAAALEPFHDVSPRRPANGNGLGLPLARALVGANGASLSIRSRPHEGTLVEVSFPPAPAEDARRPA